jgi:hypothetical protein
MKRQVRRKLEIYNTEFLRRKRTFHFPVIKFDEAHKGLSDLSPPPLLVRTNAAFLEHRDWVDQLLRDLDLLQVSGNEEVKKDELVTEVKAHVSFLDKMILRAWDQFKAGSTQSEVEFVDCCMLGYFFDFDI